MTGDLVLDLLISLGGVAVLVVVSFVLGGWRSVKVDEVAARERLAFDEPDFNIGEWFISEDGASAAATALGGEEIALVFSLGDGLATRRLRAGAIKITVEDAVVTLRLNDPSKGRLRLVAPGPDAAERWAGRLDASGYN